MKPSFFKFAIVICVLSFTINFITPMILIAMKLWHTDWSWITIWGNLPLYFVLMYLSYKFYSFKKVKVIFFLDFILFLFALIGFYTAVVNKMTKEPASYDHWTMYVIYGMGIIIATAILISPLRKERLFLVFSIGLILIRTTQLASVVLHLLPLLSVTHLVALIFQLMWIMIYYRELTLSRKDEILDQ